MKVSIGPKPIIHPHPVLIVGSYNPDGRANLMTASWGGICCSEPPCIAISLREATQTYHNIMKHQAFTISIPSEAQIQIADYLGIASGRDVDKFTEAGLTAVRSEKVNAPYAEEFSYAMECRLLSHAKLGLHTQFIGEILDIKADERILSEKRLPDIEKTQAGLFGSFGTNYYYGVGKKLGKAFSIGRALQKS
ncbi:MAG: flavin reductase family protein [Oligoflexales bacterium]|nr:flavin reductase family protein [Oligoflexales bacterium]